MHNTRRLITGLAVGSGVAIAGGLVGLALLRVAWPGYAAAEPFKAYSLAMLAARLAVGAVCTACGACLATTTSGRHTRVAWWLGGLFVAASLPSHLYYSRLDYPLWYHIVYLGYLIPIAVLTGRAVRARDSGASCRVCAT